MHSERFNEFRNYFRFGLWTAGQLKKAVKKKWITASEYEEITGTLYNE